MKKNISIFVGSLLLGAGLYFFLLVHDISAGGVSGLSLVFSNLFNVDLGIINFILNALVLVLGGIFVSVDFAKKSLLSAVTVSIEILLFERFLPGFSLSSDALLNTLCGPIVLAAGLGLIFYNGGSSGGTDVIATIINKYTSVPIHISLFFADFTVVVLSAFVIGIEKSMYATLAIIIQSIALDNAIQGLGRKIAVYVISDKYEEINEILIKKHNRGVTLLHAEGGYTGREKKLILTVSTFRRYPLIKEDILKVDDRAFIFTNSISEVLGEGFTLKQLN